jgi:S1-C subfamily serine protease
VLGDIVVGIDDNKIESANNLFDVLERYKAGDTVKLHILRDGKAAEVSVTLGASNS